MSQPQTDRQKTAFFVGIGGIGMSALARHLNRQGWQVAGYDRIPTPLTQALQNEGIQVVHEERENLMPDHADLVVYTPAVPPGNTFLMKARRLKIPAIKRAELLGKITSKADRLIAVAGTHGKTTTTTLTGFFAEVLSLQPTVFTGGVCLNWQSNYLPGSDHLHICEADEYDRSFLHLEPYIAVITLVEPDHPDTYASEKDMLKAFASFLEKTKPNGKVLMSTQAWSRLKPFLPGAREYWLIGEDPGAHFRVGKLSLRRHVLRLPTFHTTLRLPSGQTLPLELPATLPGPHNAFNVCVALAAIALLAGEEAATRAARALPRFKGIERRFQLIYGDYFRGLVSDYAHHPTEICRCIETARMLWPDERITVFFHPHLYSRTRLLAKDFGEALSLAEQVVVTDIYPAREKPIEGVTPQLILQHVSHNEKYYVPFDQLTSWLKTHKTRVLVVAGAGNIDILLGEFEKTLKSQWFPKVNMEDRAITHHLQRLVSEGAIKEYEPLAKHTTLRIGGPARWFVEPATKGELIRLLEWLHKEEIPYFVLGRGSNLLVGDGGISGVVISTGKCLSFIEWGENGRVRVGAGYDWPSFVLKTIKQGYQGLEATAGIPGTVGGCIIMNAGAYGTEVFQHLREIEVFLEGKVQRLTPHQVRYSYRYTNLTDGVVLEAVFELQPTPNRHEVEERRRALLRQRNATQPLNMPNAGCIFKNPPGTSAGKLIDQCGLKGLKIGGVMVSEKHANFLVNTGNGTALDMLMLIEEVRNRVFEETGILLQMEVKKVGNFNPPQDATLL